MKNRSATSALAIGVWAVNDSSQQATIFNAFQASKTATSATWKRAFKSNAGAADIGIDLEPTADAENTASQPIYLTAYGAAKGLRIGTISASTTGDILLNASQAAGGTQFYANSALIGVLSQNYTGFRGKLTSGRTRTLVTTDGNVAYTAAQVLSGTINRGGMTDNRVDTIAAAADIVALLPQCTDNLTSFQFIVRNANSTAKTVTLSQGTGNSLKPSDNLVLNQNTVRVFNVLVTNCSTPALTIDCDSYSTVN